MMILKIIFPLLMVIGALGSLIVEIANKGDWATALQWIGACLLYTALTFRNIRWGGYIKWQTEALQYEIWKDVWKNEY